VSMADTDNETKRREAQNREREEELLRVPVQNIDKSKWPTHVRPISISETGGLGIDHDRRLYWDGKPVEIISQRIDLTRTQTFIGLSVAIFTLIAALATVVQAWTAYHEWACKVGWSVLAKCPSETVIPKFWTD
jgi:hypothetical protein